MAAIETNNLLETIAGLEKELNRLKSALGVEGAIVAPAKKERKARNPDAKPNPWIQFKGRVQTALKDAAKGEGNPATVAVLFCKHLKDANPEGVAYAMETDAILAAYDTWATPEVIEHAKSLKRSKKDSASESGSVADTESEAEKPKERKKPAPLTDEQKAEKTAKAKATREANKAKKEAAAAEVSEEEPKPESEVKKAAFKPKKVTAKKEEPKYTREQLSDFAEFEHEGEAYGVNMRGDVINSDGAWAGHWDGKALNKAAPKPADFDSLFE